MNAQSVPLFARQPIVTPDQGVIGYELLFRGAGYLDKDFDGDQATTEVLLNAFTEVGIDDAINNQLAFVNYTKTLLNRPPEHFRGKLVIELLEDIDVDDVFIEKIGNLTKRGFIFALDDFEPNSAAAALIPHVKYVKLDVQSLTENEISTFCQCAPDHITVIAEKIETKAQFVFCQAAGCKLFQGYFFAKPEIMTGSNLSPSKVVTLQLMANLANPDADINVVQQMVASDPTLTFKILRTVNSGLYRRATTIESLQHAIIILGLNELRSIVSMLLMLQLSEGHPAAQIVSLTRAHFIAGLANRVEPDLVPQAFTTAVLSYLQQSLGSRADTLISSLNMNDQIKEALASQQGILGSLLETVLANEKLDEHGINWAFLAQHGITRSELAKLYICAASKSDSYVKALG